MAASALIHDDYVAFCEGVRGLCDIDLLQYKRGQMERRVRSFAERRGHAGLAPYLRAAGRRRRRARRVPRSRDDQRLQPVAQPRAVGAPAPRRRARARRRRHAARLERGLLVRRRGLHAGRRLPPGRPDRAARRSSGPTSTAARSSAPERGEFDAEDVRDAPPNALARFFAADGERWRPTAELRALVSFEVGDLLRLRPPAGAYDLVLCRNTVIYFNEDVRDALHERLADALRPGGVLVVGATERVTAPEAIGLQATAPFTYAKEA